MDDYMKENAFLLSNERTDIKPLNTKYKIEKKKNFELQETTTSSEIEFLRRIIKIKKQLKKSRF